jgi:hypothetical protein
MVTSLPLYEEILRPWARRKEIALMPVLSTVGEPASPPLLASRCRAVVVFGGAGVRRRAYTLFQPALVRTVQALDADEVWDIGPAVDTPAAVGGVRVRTLGVLPPSEVSPRLADAVAGFLAYPPLFLAKSGIFAAYCAHGLLPVCAWDGQRRERNPPAAEQHYWSAGDEGPGDPQAIASAARNWYAGHSSERQADTFRKLLLSEAPT